MEKKTTQRIIGILIAIALIVILMPLVFSKNDGMQQAASMKAPPFPDQEQNKQTASNDVDITQEMADKVNAMTTITEAKTEAKPEQKLQPQPDASFNQASSEPTVTRIPIPDQQANSPVVASAASVEPLDTAEVAQNQPIQTVEAPATQTAASTESVKAPTTTPASANASEPVSAEPIANVEQHTDAALESVKPLSEETASLTKSDVTPALDETIESKTDLNAASPSKKPKAMKHSLHKQSKMVSNTPKLKHEAINPKDPAWVVQMGSFKEKANATRLANKLRASGYKAFTREITSAHGSVQTRVYIGPEHKQVAALKLSSEVEQQMKIHGLVIKYKPLEL